MQRIGVFVCHCGTNIAATVDVKKVVDVISKEPGVVHAEDYQYMCSETGQQKVIDAIQNEHLTGVVICSCSPRMHEGTFRKAAEKAGLNPYQLEIANIREQCSWIHKDMEEATEKAVILARAAVAKVMLDTHSQQFRINFYRCHDGKWSVRDVYYGIINNSIYYSVYYGSAGWSHLSSHSRNGKGHGG